MKINLDKLLKRETVTDDVLEFAKECHVLPEDEVTPIVREYIKWRNCSFTHEDTLGLLKIKYNSDRGYN